MALQNQKAPSWSQFTRFKILNKNKPQVASFYCLVTPAGVEPAIFWMRTRRPGPLDEGAKLLRYYFNTKLSSIQHRHNLARPK